MQQTNAIIIIVCYFGEFPWYFDYFIKSCEYNRDTNFLIISDQLPIEKYKICNIRYIYKTIEDFNTLASSKLHKEVHLQNAYKLCDFKPVYGYLFSDLITEYQFWGHSDIDIIYGKIRNFITDDILLNYDIISVRHDYITGFFALYRNSATVNLLFSKSKDFERIIYSEKYCGFDECSGLCLDLSNGFLLDELKADYESMTHLVKKRSQELRIQCYFDFHVIEGLPGELQWNSGRLMYKKRFEVILYHMIDFKRLTNLNIPKWELIPEKFFIHKSSISA